MRLFSGIVYRVWRMAWTSGRLFGFWHGVGSAFYIVVPVFTFLTLALDRIFYPSIHRIPIKNPVFILGNARSGTTFLHRLLSHDNNFVMFHLWEMFLPSLCGRKVIGPFMGWMFERFRRSMADGSSYFGEGTHDTEKDAIEEEEVLFFTILESPMALALTPLAFDPVEHADLIYSDRMPAWRKKAAMKYLRQCLQRQIYASGKQQVMAKMPYSTMRIKAILEEFPDAKIVYLVRSPLSTVPSHLSMHRAYFDHKWGLDRIPHEEQMRYFARRYRYNVAMYQYIHELRLAQELPPDNFMVLNYDRLLSDLDAAFADFEKFTGIEVSDSLRETVRVQADKQRQYRRIHQNLHLEQFGLTEEQVIRDLGFVFDEFGYSKGEPDSEAPKDGGANSSLKSDTIP